MASIEESGDFSEFGHFPAGEDDDGGHLYGALGSVEPGFCTFSGGLRFAFEFVVSHGYPCWMDIPLHSRRSPVTSVSLVTSQ